MKFKKTHILIVAFIIFWIGFIGWGMLKTSLKLAKKGQPETTAKPTKTAETLTPPSAPSPEPSPILVETFKVKLTDYKDILPVMGSVKGKTEIELRFEINGIIKTIFFREGEKIKKGDLIACLDPRDSQLRLDYVKNKFNSTQATYDSSLKKLEAYQKLYEVGAIIKSKLEEMQLECESARYQVETVKSEMELAKNELQKTFLYATKDAVMGPREAEESEFITTQDKLGSLLEISEVFVEIGVVERDIDKIKLGEKVEVTLDAYPYQVFLGTVDSIFPIVEGKSRTLTIKVKIANPEGLLLPGMFARANIFVAELKNVIIVPTTSLIKVGPEVNVVPLVLPGPYSKEEIEKGNQPGQVDLRQVGIGYSTTDYVQITSGLAVGDLIITKAGGEIKAGTKVKVAGIEEGSF